MSLGFSKVVLVGITSPCIPTIPFISSGPLALGHCSLHVPFVSVLSGNVPGTKRMPEALLQVGELIGIRSVYVSALERECVCELLIQH